MIQKTHIPQFIGNIHGTYTLNHMKLYQQNIAFIIEKNIKGYKTSTIQKQPREKRHVNVLWSAVKDFENNFALNNYFYCVMILFLLLI